jgi:hypothetical protein
MNAIAQRRDSQVQNGASNSLDQLSHRVPFLAFFGACKQPPFGEPFGQRDLGDGEAIALFLSKSVHLGEGGVGIQEEVISLDPPNAPARSRPARGGVLVVRRILAVRGAPAPSVGVGHVGHLSFDTRHMGTARSQSRKEQCEVSLDGISRGLMSLLPRRGIQQGGLTSGTQGEGFLDAERAGLDAELQEDVERSDQLSDHGRHSPVRCGTGEFIP